MTQILECPESIYGAPKPWPEPLLPCAFTAGVENAPELDWLHGYSEFPRVTHGPAGPINLWEPTTGDPCDSSSDPNVDSGEALEKQGDQPKSPDPGLHDNLPPQGPKPEMANKEENNVVLGLSFPRKLYAAFTSVRWNDEGDMVVTEADLFQTEVLQRRGADQIFETESVKSFIRELNLYGFSKICPSCHSAGKKTMVMYRVLLGRLD